MPAPSIGHRMDQSASTNRETILEGIPVSRGIGIAPIHVIARGFAAPDVHGCNCHLSTCCGRKIG